MLDPQCSMSAEHHDDVLYADDRESKRYLEIACFNATSCLIACKVGADRLELCANQSLGGTTPPRSLVSDIQGRTLGVTTYVMIRPRGGDFVYTDDEYARMEEDITAYQQHAHGFVFGILDGQGRVDELKCRRLLRRANGLPCTFHRAFDEISEDDMLQQLEALIDCGFKAVLTSGGKNGATASPGKLRELILAARGRIEVIIGGGVRSDNVEMLRNHTGAKWFHSSAITDGGGVACEGEILKLKTLLQKQ